MAAPITQPPVRIPYTGQGETALWSAVVQQGLDDLDYEPFGSLLHADAAAFLLNGGEWAKARGEVADMLGVHPDDIRRCGVRHMMDRRHAEGIPEPVAKSCPVPVPRQPLPRLVATFGPKPRGRGRPRYVFGPYRRIASAAD